MSSPPSPRDFNGLIAETWGKHALDRSDVMALLEPYRETVDHYLDDFDDENQSWRSYCDCIYGYGRGPHYGGDGAIPYAVQDEVARLLTSPAPESGAPPDVPPYDTLHIGALSSESTLTFAPMSRAGLLSMRETIDRALATPGTSQTSATVIGGANYRVTLTCAVDDGERV